MKIALIADSFPPMRTSSAVQLRDLSREFSRQGHSLTVFLPSADLSIPWQLENLDGFQVVRLRAPRIKGINYFLRTINEFLMPFIMYYRLTCSPWANSKWDGVVWYSPSIFLAPLVRSLKKRSGCRGYLIIRDIFPQWAVDIGLMGRGLPYLFFEKVAQYQYSVADVIGIQSPSNSLYFDNWSKSTGRSLEVLNNWLDKPEKMSCSIKINETPLAGRSIFVYAGNMGVAQGLDIIIELAKVFLPRSDVGFLFVGRGTEVPRLKNISEELNLSNVLFYDEISPDEIPKLYAQCSVGLIALHARHKSHNIPGKFLTYMQSGLPVLANINLGNDLATVIREEKVGQVCESNKIEDLALLAEQSLMQANEDNTISVRCSELFRHEYSVDRAVRQIVSALTNVKNQK